VNSNLVVVGSLNADLVIRVPRFLRPGETLTAEQFQMFPGGKGANQAYAAAKLGGRVSMVGQVGGDSHAGWLKSNLASVGVDVSHVLADSTVSSGLAMITIDAAGQNQIVIVPGANGTFEPERLEQSRGLLSGSGFVLLQLEVALATVVAAAKIAKAAGAVVILDPAPARQLPDDLLQNVDYLTPNETELAILTRREASFGRAEAVFLAANLLKRGPKNVIVKMGGQGALLLNDTGDHFWPALPVKAVDTTAAGDAFNAAFAVGLARGKAVREAGTYATAAAACSVRCPGAQPSMPDAREVEELLAQSPLG
jgi:ribokinase